MRFNFADQIEYVVSLNHCGLKLCAQQNSSKINARILLAGSTQSANSSTTKFCRIELAT